MSDEPFGRQPKPVKITFEGEQIDIDYYMNVIRSFIENRSYDNAVRAGNVVTIYPRAVND